MKIKKIFNNNVVLSEMKEQEIIVMGRGLAFGKKVDDELDVNKIDKRYILSQNHREVFLKFLQNY